MKNFNKAALRLAVALTVLLCVGCGEYIPSKVYKIKTVDGEILNLYCPAVDRERSVFTYTISHECRLTTD